MSEAEFLPPEQPIGSLVPRQLLATMWARIAERLRAGEVLITSDDFQAALAEEYRILTGGELKGEARSYVRQIVEVVNARYPETYVTQGIQNGVYKAFGHGVRALQWTEAKIQARGAKSLRTFGRKESMRELLDEVNVRLDQLDLLQIVKTSIEEIRKEGPGATPVAGVAEILNRDFNQLPVESAAKPVLSDSTPEILSPDMQEAIALGDVQADEVRERTLQEKKKGQQLLAKEMKKIPQRLDSLVDQQQLTRAEADQYRQLRKIDERVEKGEIEAAEGTRIRNSLMDGEARAEIESKVRKEVEQSSRYLHAFDSMRKIDRGTDNALAFLIRHKQTVVADRFEQEEIAAIHRELTDDAVLLKDIIDIMERKDQEIRMISVRLPPYNYIVKRGVEKIGNMTIEESFLDELRHLDVDDISERMNSGVSEIRIKPAADMRCMVSLIDHVIKKTPFRKEIRFLRISLTIQEFFDSTSDLQEARHQAESFVSSRMRRLFPDMSSEEMAEIRQRSAEIIDEIEKKVLDGRRAEVEEKRQRAGSAQQQQQVNGEDEEELSDQEKELGVQIGRVEIRVAGNLRKIPRKIMPDPDEPGKFVIAVRDPETGETVAEERRGSKRYVERGRDSVWRAI